MRIDTELLNELASRIDQLKSDPILDTPELVSRHQEIQAALSSISMFLRQVSSLTIQTEDSLFRDVPIVHGGSSGFSASGYVSGKPENLLKGSSIKASGRLHYSLDGAEAVLEEGPAYFTGTLNVAECVAAGSASLRLFERKSFDPSLKIKGELSGNLANASAKAGISNGVAGAFVEGVAEVGAVYASAEAAFSTEGFDVEASVGAAAARGECSLGFNLGDLEISLTAEGSLCSAEMGFEYHHTAREWEIGSKLGFIAGVGLKINIKY